jgi:hypothetical protein
LDEGFCSAVQVEVDPEGGCRTYKQSGLLQDLSWDDEIVEDEGWDDMGYEEGDDDDAWLDAFDEEDD